MRNSAFLAVFLAVSAGAQTRSVQLAVAPVPGVAAPAFTPALSAQTFSAAALTPALAPLLASPSVLVPIPSVVPALTPVRATPATPAVRLAALTAGVAKAAAALGDKPGADAAAGAGRQIEELLTGALIPSSPSSPEDVAYVLGASRGLAERADELGAAKGLKISAMSGADFLGLLDEARASAPPAPSPAASAAAGEVTAQVLRVARALIPADKPARESLPRALAVWQVFDQEMALAADKGGLDGVVADAKLFASQVEASVAPAPKPLAAPTPRPEDPEDMAAQSVPGSVFGWKPIETSPGHGFPPLDSLIRRALSEKGGSYAKGLDFSGASGRGSASVFLYGERHSDGGLIAENMRRVAADAKPGKPMIVLVEGYTGFTMRGFKALEYLADRGLDPDALKAKGIAGIDVEVRGWDTAKNYGASKHPMLQHHMNMLELNSLAHGELRGWNYYRTFARAALTAARSGREMWNASIVARNGDLDRATAAAVADAAISGATVHVIAGTDHLIQNPRLAGIRWLGRPALRRSLLAAIDGLPYWASKPADTIP